jgi:hypothetical protein
MASAYRPLIQHGPCLPRKVRVSCAEVTCYFSFSAIVRCYFRCGSVVAVLACGKKASRGVREKPKRSCCGA